MKLIGPFKQLVSLDELPLRGKLSDEHLCITKRGGILVKDGMVEAIGDFETLKEQADEIVIISGDKVAIPAFVDAHTHICFGGNRANDFAMRNAGKTYLEIAAAGGGIWSSVVHTREASEEELLETLLQRIHRLIQQGVTTIEIKSGYGLTAHDELKMLRVIKKAQEQTPATLISTCLAAHTKPKDFQGDNSAYLNYILKDILPRVKKDQLAERVDIFIEKSAFHPEESRLFLESAKAMGFALTVHADQFTPGSSRVAVEVGAQSADHLEATADQDIQLLAESNTVAIALPGASLGLGEPFAPARKLLDAGAILAIATDWNPGSAPMGNLVAQSSILATYQKLSTAEVLSGITFRAAYALGLQDRGVLAKGKKADFLVYDTDNYQNILYQQGQLSPQEVYISGLLY